MDKLLVITGGTKGIGRAIVERFAQEGFDVFTCARNETQLQEMADHLDNIYDVKCYYVQADLSVRDDVFGFIDAVREMNRPIDVLVNNAGIFIPGQIHTEDPGTFEKTMDTNLTSAYHITRGLIPLVIQAKGYIFNMCSTASFTAYANGGSYCISKFGLLGMSRVLRQEMMEKEVRVTAVMPGAVWTDSWKASGLSPERFMQPVDIAHSVYEAYALPSRTVLEELVLRPGKGDVSED